MIKKLFSFLIMMLLTSSYVYADRIRDLVSIQGVRENSLVGYGIVVGLDGTGDQTSQTPFTVQSITNMLSQLGITVPTGGNMQLKNVAAVIVTAKLPPFPRIGQKVDVVVSSLGNAKSLRGGTLIMTPLKGADSQIYAIAQGNLFVGGMGASAPGASVTVNQMAGATIPNGATIERELDNLFTKQNIIELHLNTSDFTQALMITDAINKVKKDVATAIDSSTIAVKMPLTSGERVRFLSDIQNINVNDAPVSAKVIINTRTGVVVMNRDVKLDNCAIAQGNLSVEVNSGLNVNQPNTPLAGGETVVTPETQVNVNESGGSLHNIPKSVSLNGVLKSLNVLGASPTELMSVLESLKNAGCLHASLETI